MRILIATYHTVPGCSGGWTTPLELLEHDHDVMYAVARGREGDYMLEGIPVRGLAGFFRPPFPKGIAGKAVRRLSEFFFGSLIENCFRDHGADFILCLDILSARQCISRGLPYGLRIHTQPTTTPPEELKRLLDGSLFATICPSVKIDGVEVLPHTEDLSRFRYIEHGEARQVLLLSSLDEAWNPMLFARGLMMSSMSGTIAGEGPLRDQVEDLCLSSGGKLNYHPPVLRKELPSFLGGFQIGVACHVEVENIYQMKVHEYQASGIFPIVTPWTHLASEAPHLTLTFRTPEELAARIDHVAGNWDSTLDIRRMGREYALNHYGIQQARERFATILRESGLL